MSKTSITIPAQPRIKNKGLKIKIVSHFSLEFEPLR